MTGNAFSFGEEILNRYNNFDVYNFGGKSLVFLKKEESSELPVNITQNMYLVLKLMAKLNSLINTKVAGDSITYEKNITSKLIESYMMTLKMENLNVYNQIAPIQKEVLEILSGALKLEEIKGKEKRRVAYALRTRQKKIEEKILLKTEKLEKEYSEIINNLNNSQNFNQNTVSQVEISENTNITRNSEQNTSQTNILHNQNSNLVQNQRVNQDLSQNINSNSSFNQENTAFSDKLEVNNIATSNKENITKSNLNISNQNEYLSISADTKNTTINNQISNENSHFYSSFEVNNRSFNSETVKNINKIGILGTVVSKNVRVSSAEPLLSVSKEITLFDKNTEYFLKPNDDYVTSTLNEWISQDVSIKFLEKYSEHEKEKVINALNKLKISEIRDFVTGVISEIEFSKVQNIKSIEKITQGARINVRNAVEEIIRESSSVEFSKIRDFIKEQSVLSVETIKKLENIPKERIFSIANEVIHNTSESYNEILSILQENQENIDVNSLEIIKNSQNIAPKTLNILNSIINSSGNTSVFNFKEENKYFNDLSHGILNQSVLNNKKIINNILNEINNMANSQNITQNKAKALTSITNFMTDFRSNIVSKSLEIIKNQKFEENTAIHLGNTQNLQQSISDTHYIYQDFDNSSMVLHDKAQNSLVNAEEVAKLIEKSAQKVITTESITRNSSINENNTQNIVNSTEFSERIAKITQNEISNLEKTLEQRLIQQKTELQVRNQREINQNTVNHKNISQNSRKFNTISINLDDISTNIITSDELYSSIPIVHKNVIDVFAMERRNNEIQSKIFKNIREYSKNTLKNTVLKQTISVAEETTKKMANRVIENDNLEITRKNQEIASVIHKNDVTTVKNQEIYENMKIFKDKAVALKALEKGSVTHEAVEKILSSNTIYKKDLDFEKLSKNVKNYEEFSENHAKKYDLEKSHEKVLTEVFDEIVSRNITLREQNSAEVLQNNAVIDSKKLKETVKTSVKKILDEDTEYAGTETSRIVLGKKEDSNNEKIEETNKIINKVREETIVLSRNQEKIMHELENKIFEQEKAIKKMGKQNSKNLEEAQKRVNTEPLDIKNVTNAVMNSIKKELRLEKQRRGL